MIGKFKTRQFFIVLFLLVGINTIAQQIPSNKVISTNNLHQYLTTDAQIKLSASNLDLAEYFKLKFSERFFFNYNNFATRFNEYNTLYPHMQKRHESRALDHLGKYADSTLWKLPFNYLNGQPVNAYALRHLARQHKMVDIAFYNSYNNTGNSYVEYFVNQMASLNAALENNSFEKIEDGNGVYEAFRNGYRVLNWLQIHSMFLSEEQYSNTDQLTTIATLLQHGAFLYKTNAKFKSGNHQTRGLSALAMIAILLRDFKGTAVWYEHAINLLEQHLNAEINSDGFQFERSVHYHISDIANYYYVYRLAQISNIPIGESWEQKLRSLFTTLIYIAYPDKSAPVLQDDTDNPWAEKNDISSTLTLGYLIFNDPEMGYFASGTVEPKMYWFVSKKQLASLGKISRKKPEVLSYNFPATGYYIMRDGWNTNDKMMIISAGLDEKKPDHQHGDMLGIQAMVNGQVILPNYQVRYPLSDFQFFKNSMVKNVALVDNELQGKQWKGNKGGSGFGKFKQLPVPKVLYWETDTLMDVFIGSHNGFSEIGVDYTRTVINIRNEFWIVRDHFISDSTHTYKQVWQGHYTIEKPYLLRSTYSNGSGCDIYQLISTDSVHQSGTRGKHWSVVSKTRKGAFNFVTAIFPFNTYSNRINEESEMPKLANWELNNAKYIGKGENFTSLSQSNTSFAFNIKELSFNNINISFSATTDIVMFFSDHELKIKMLGANNVEATIKGASKLLLNKNVVSGSIMLKAGNSLHCKY